MTFYGKLRHIPGTPMTKQEMEEQCDFISKIIDDGIIYENEEEQIRKDRNLLKRRDK